MKQLLILLTCVCFLFAQDLDKTIGDFTENIPGMFEISEEMKEKIEEAKAKHKDIIEKIKAMTSERKIAFFEKIREEAKAKMDIQLEELPPELKAKIKAHMAEIKVKFEKKKRKIAEIKDKIEAKNKASIDMDLDVLKAIIEEFKSKYFVTKDLSL